MFADFTHLITVQKPSHASHLYAFFAWGIIVMTFLVILL